MSTPPTVDADPPVDDVVVFDVVVLVVAFDVVVFDVVAPDPLEPVEDEGAAAVVTVVVFVGTGLDADVTEWVAVVDGATVPTAVDVVRDVVVVAPEVDPRGASVLDVVLVTVADLVTRLVTGAGAVVEEAEFTTPETVPAEPVGAEPACAKLAKVAPTD